MCTYIDNMCLALTDNVKIPLPDFSSNGLANGSENPKVLHLVLHMLISSTLEQSQRGRGNVELADIVLVDNVPVAREVGIRRSTLKHDCSHTQQKWRVDDISMACNPSYITTAEENVVVVNVENVLSSCCSANEVSSSSVHDTLGLSSRSRCVKQEERVFRAHRLWWEVVGVLLDLLVPPPISALGPWHLSSSTLVHETMADIWALLQGFVDNLLGADDFAATLALVCGDNDLGFSVDDAVTK